MEPHGSPSGGRLKEVVVAETSKKDEAERKYFSRLIKQMEMKMKMKMKVKQLETDEEYFAVSKKMPRPTIVKYHDYLGKLWGWDKLLPKGTSVSSPVYDKYLEEYHSRNVHAATTDTSISTLAETCLNNEEKLVQELMHRMTREQQTSLVIRRSIILSCLVKERARSVNNQARRKVSGAALLCIAKEARLVFELLRRGTNPIDDYLINQSRVICLCALSLMNCNSVSASAAMLGMAKEAEMICMWMVKNDKHVGFYDDPIPNDIQDRHTVRSSTLDFMVSILQKSFAEHNIDKEEPASRSGPHGDEYGIAVDGAANTTSTSGSFSDVLNYQYNNKEKSRGEEDSKKTEREEENILEKLWGWERLVPLGSYVERSDYGNYLEEYYKHNANGFVAAAAAAKNPQNTTTTDMGAAVAKFCLKMEKELMQSLDDASTIIESSLIMDCALNICSTGDIPSIVAFVCIKEEANLMRELLKHGAKPSDDIIQLSNVIRMCALSLGNLTGPQSIASAAAMMGMANEAKIMCDWMKRENKRITLSLCQPRELHGSYLIRMKALDVMTTMLQECFFPFSKEDPNLLLATGCDKGFIHFWYKDKEKPDPDRRYEQEYYSNHLRPEKTRIPNTSDVEEEEEKGAEEKGADDEEEEDDNDEDVDTEVGRERELEVVVEYLDLPVRKVKRPKEYRIKAEAAAILKIIERGGDPSKEQVKSLCENITSGDSE